MLISPLQSAFPKSDANLFEWIGTIEGPVSTVRKSETRRAPIHDFASLKTIAAFLDIHLGIDDDGEGHSAQVKKRRREQTGMRLAL